jgi:hypothetical protein
MCLQACYVMTADVLLCLANRSATGRLLTLAFAAAAAAAVSYNFFGPNELEPVDLTVATWLECIDELDRCVANL